MSTRRLQRELEAINANPQENVVFRVDPKSLLDWELYIKSFADGFYNGGIFKVILKFNSDYPFKPPKLKFATRIYHPNITEEGAVCLGVLKSENWKPSIKIIDIATYVIDLIHNPVPSESLRSEIGHVFETDMDTYRKNCLEWAKKYCLSSAKEQESDD